MPGEKGSIILLNNQRVWDFRPSDVGATTDLTTLQYMVLLVISLGHVYTLLFDQTSPSVVSAFWVHIRDLSGL